MAAIKRSILLVSAFLALGAGGLSADQGSGFLSGLSSFQAFRPGLGGLLIINADPQAGIETTDLITNTLDIGFEYPFAEGSPFTFEPSFMLYGSYYTLSDARKAVPCGAEFRDVYMVGLLLDLPVVFNLDLGKGLRFSAGGGLAIHLRAGFKVADAAQADVVAINGYFWGAGRFLLPSMMVRLDFPASERLRLGLEAKTYWPLFNLLAGEGLSFFDQQILSLTLAVRFAVAPTPPAQ